LGREVHSLNKIVSLDNVCKTGLLFLEI
jgi:hypothetical protein